VLQYSIIIVNKIGLEELIFKHGFDYPSKTNLDISNQPALTSRLMCQCFLFNVFGEVDVTQLSYTNLYQ